MLKYALQSMYECKYSGLHSGSKTKCMVYVLLRKSIFDFFTGYKYLKNMNIINYL